MTTLNDLTDVVITDPQAGQRLVYESGTWVNKTAAGPGSYVRPADWLTLPAVGNTEQKFVGLHAVWPDSNFLALSAAGNYTVDWGDGNIENFASDVTAYHQYDYSLISNTTDSTRGYRQVIVTVTPQAGQNLTNINLNLKHNQTNLQAYASGWLDILISGPNLTSLQIAGNTSTINVRHRYLEQAQLISANSIASMAHLFNGCGELVSLPVWTTSAAALTDTSFMFNNCSSLQTVPLFNTAAVTNTASMFNNCSSLQTVPLFNTAAVTNMRSMFSGCVSLQTVPVWTTSAAALTDTSFMFYNCYSLQTVPLFNTAAVTNMSYMFYNCYSLQTVPAFNCNGVTSSTNFSNMFATCNSLISMKATNIKYTFSVANCKLSAAALNEIYTNLPTVTGQTITVTGNWGVATDDPTIATAKGWTVTG